MKIFKTQWFNKWAKKEKISDEVLKDAILEFEKGVIDADLGGSVYKKRLPMKGKGKRGGARALIACKLHHISFFIYGFAKNTKENITEKELKALKYLAKELLFYTDKGLEKAIKSKELIEMDLGEKENEKKERVNSRSSP